MKQPKLDKNTVLGALLDLLACTLLVGVLVFINYIILGGLI